MCLSSKKDNLQPPLSSSLETPSIFPFTFSRVSCPLTSLLSFVVLHGGTVNSSRATSPLVRLVEEKQRWEAPDHLQEVSPSKLAVKFYSSCSGLDHHGIVLIGNGNLLVKSPVPTVSRRKSQSLWRCVGHHWDSVLAIIRFTVPQNCVIVWDTDNNTAPLIDGPLW
ncbi:hypothetical protein TNCV_2989161 [Trichonephila clavipes]|nr:hypothetical protein TNCV_2989161 [Trichonephila clavipes]